MNSALAAEVMQTVYLGAKARCKSCSPSCTPFTGCGKNRVYQRRDEPFHRRIGYVSSMRGDDEQQAAVFSYLMPEQQIPQSHPLRAIRALVDRALREQHLHFYALYARRGRPSIPPERLLRALLLMALY